MCSRRCIRRGLARAFERGKGFSVREDGDSGGLHSHSCSVISDISDKVVGRQHKISTNSEKKTTDEELFPGLGEGAADDGESAENSAEEDGATSSEEVVGGVCQANEA